MLKQMKVSELSPGMMVTQVIEQNGAVKIRKVGFIRSEDMIRGLTEMGVAVVEVDLAQSLNVELDNDLGSLPDITPESEKADVALTAATTKLSKKSTATQRLVASNKQIADVDRQLSQQFHRSLFLPAVDQMPSKWMLYGKPYSLLLGFILIGLFIGLLVSYSLFAWMSPPNFAVIETSSVVLPTDASQMAVNAAPEQQSNNQAANIKESPASQSSESQAKPANNVAVTNTQPTVTQTAASIEPEPIDSSETTQSVNGVVLEAGQQVLGYQSEQQATVASNLNEPENRPDQSSPGSSITGTASTNNNALPQPTPIATNRGASNNELANSANGNDNESLNRDLLRRIQAAAQDVDNEPAAAKAPALKVTDLNDLPRIDQLSPAILTQMPAMSFSAHMYASNPRDRWVRVNSQRLGEGDVIANNVVLKRIESEKVVLEYKGQEFTMNALSDW